MTDEGLYVQIGTISDLELLAKDLINEHFVESGAKDKGLRLSPDFESIACLERLGRARTILLFKKEELIGYCVLIFFRPVHYEMRVAFVDSLWVSAKHRAGTGAGKKLISEMQRISKMESAELISMHSKFDDNRHQKFLLRNGFKQEHIVFSKELR